MLMLMYILGILTGFIGWCNLCVTHFMTEEEMRDKFITKQNKFGMVFVNTFYALAWALKRMKKFVK